jgi:hypothetical protein
VQHGKAGSIRLKRKHRALALDSAPNGRPVNSIAAYDERPGRVSSVVIGYGLVYIPVASTEAVQVRETRAVSVHFEHGAIASLSAVIGGPVHVAARNTHSAIRIGPVIVSASRSINAGELVENPESGSVGLHRENCPVTI